VLLFSLGGGGVLAWLLLGQTSSVTPSKCGSVWMLVWCLVMLARAAEFPWITHAVFQAVCMLYQGMLGKATETMAAVLKAQVRAGIGHVPALARARKDGPARFALLHPGSAPVPTGASLGPHGTNRNLHPVRRHAGRAGRWRARLVLLLLCFWFWGGRCPSSSPSSRRETEQIAGLPERTRTRTRHPRCHHHTRVVGRHAPVSPGRQFNACPTPKRPCSVEMQRRMSTQPERRVVIVFPTFKKYG